MEKYVVNVIRTDFVTYNVKRFVIEKPAGYNFIPGQATDVAINKTGLEEELRPFTFTSLNDWKHLEFTIKIYKGHNGITEQLLDLLPGDQLIIHEVFGAINYQGPGLFIAGGAGITPFIAILRQLQQDGKLAGNKLLFANHTDDDIILKDELKAMLGDHHIDIIAHPDDVNIKGSHIDMALLKQHITGEAQYYYICGPDQFTEAMVQNLVDLGIERSRIILEQ